MPLADRFVEVIADAGVGASPRYRYGSGCIVAGRTVLTAAHVVNGCITVQVRTAKKALYPARVDVSFVGHVSGPAPDLALVEVDSLALDFPALPLARLDRDSEREASVECHVFGYPWFAKRPSPTTVRDVVDAVGTIPVLSKLATGLASIQVRDAPRALPPVDQRLTDTAWSGMSGGPVISGGRLVGVVIEHAPREGQSSITIAPISLLEPHPGYPRWGLGVSDPGAWWRRLGVSDAAAMAVLPVPGAPTNPEPELAADAVEQYRAVLVAAGIAAPMRWTVNELSRITTAGGASRAGDLVTALRRAAEAKPVLTDLGVDQLGLAQLQVIYRREVGAWPGNGSADALLVQASEVEQSERRTGTTGVLGALARFVTGVAVALATAPKDHPGLATWISSLGYQVADAERRYEDHLGARAWLLLDLGAEPWPGASPWPSRIAWTHVTRHGTTTTTLAGVQPALQGREGLSDALGAIFAALPPTHQLLVDLAVPAALLDAGIEHWPLFPETLTDRHQARLRWSQRLHDLSQQGKCRERAARSAWHTMPRALTETVLADEACLQRWIRNDTAHAWLIGRKPAARSDPLRALLKAGYGFLVWFPATADPRDFAMVTRAVKKIPVAARRTVIPDEVPGSPDGHLIIWDDPRGRGDEFTLPPPTAAQPVRS